MSKCRVCCAELKTVIDFGSMPISNRFVVDPHVDEYKFNLSVGFCPECYMVELEECVPPSEMFNADYTFFSSTSTAMAEHFHRIADEIKERISDKVQPFVVELGCNDGIMLQHLAAQGIAHLGIEPSANVALKACERGVNVRTDFFNATLAREIVREYGHATVVCGSNVVCHIEDINSVFSGISEILSEEGVFFFEDPYLFDIICKTSFDQIYDEHVYYFSALSVSNLAKRHGLELVDISLQEVHGGEARYYLMKQGAGHPSARVEERLRAEKQLKLDKYEGYSDFSQRVKKISGDLKVLLEDLSAQGERIVAYGATSKSTTLLNYAGVGSNLIEYVSDITPTKIGKYCPGTLIPVKSYAEFEKNPPLYTLLLAWNHKNEIFLKEETYRNQGGRFITFFPAVVVE